jgi:hypothetical protein
MCLIISLFIFIPYLTPQCMSRRIFQAGFFIGAYNSGRHTTASLWDEQNGVEDGSLSIVKDEPRVFSTYFFLQV